MSSSFARHRAALFAAYGTGDYAAALGHAESAHRRWPEHHGDTWYWQACLLALLDRPDESVRALEEGLAEGHWWGPGMLDDETDLATVRFRADFAALRSACAARWQEAQATAAPSCLVVAPSSATWGPRSVLFLHWWGGSARDTAARWQRLVDEGWTLVAAQSSQILSPGRFCWDDRELALAEAQHHLSDCRDRRALPLDGMVVAGASQGAAIAMEAAAEAGLPWLAIIPTLGRSFDPSRLLAVPGRTRGAMLLGADDPANPRSLAVAEMLRSGGVEVAVRVVPGVGHDQDAAVIEEAVEALRRLAGGSASEC